MILSITDQGATSVRDNSKLKSGHKTRYFCSQDEGTKKASKPSQKPDAKHRENPGMTRFPCNGRLTISSRLQDESMRVVAIRLKHSVQHVSYYDVSMPSAAADIIRANIDWSTPSELIKRVQAQFPSVTANQVGEAWRSFTEVLWKRDDVQLVSATKLLAEFTEDVDVFDLRGIPEGVEILAWGMRKIASRLAGKIVEIAMDATCKRYHA